MATQSVAQFKHVHVDTPIVGPIQASVGKVVITVAQRELLADAKAHAGPESAL
jgi:hypothetical protein